MSQIDSYIHHHADAVWIEELVERGDDHPRSQPLKGHHLPLLLHIEGDDRLALVVEDKNQPFDKPSSSGNLFFSSFSEVGLK